MDEALSDNVVVGVIDIVFFVLAVLLVRFGPWSPDSWWPARVIWAIGSFCLVAGVIRLWN